MAMHKIPVAALGQVGFRLQFDETVVYIDPYLSDSVRDKEAPDLKRLVPIPVLPQTVTDAHYVLITHSHRDHCDLDTLLPLSEASPQAVFIGPPPVVAMLSEHGFGDKRLRVCRKSDRIELATGLTAICTPSAHPMLESDDLGDWLYVGYLLRWRGRQLYHAGDTALTDDVYDHLKRAGQIDAAFLPVNEINYFRDRRGIIGNMSIRDAFGLAEELGIDIVVPTHWDMFEANQVFPEEIELLYTKLAPKFKLLLRPSEV
jgi:L-ascorbate 6-phosphate lactonase